MCLSICLCACVCVVGMFMCVLVCVLWVCLCVCLCVCCGYVYVCACVCACVLLTSSNVEFFTLNLRLDVLRTLFTMYTKALYSFTSCSSSKEYTECHMHDHTRTHKHTHTQARTHTHHKLHVFQGHLLSQHHLVEWSDEESYKRDEGHDVRAPLVNVTDHL